MDTENYETQAEMMSGCVERFIVMVKCIYNKLFPFICKIAGLIKLYSFQFYETYLKRCDFVYRGIKITTNKLHIRPAFDTICQAPKFLNWLDNFQVDKYDLRSIEITDVDFFGSNKNPDKLGFLKYKCDVYTKSGEPLDGIVFLRGDCGAVLIIVSDECNNEYVLLTEQPRVPTGGSKEEIVAGMFDSQIGNTVVNNVLKREIKEETGLDMDESINSVKKLGEYTLSGGGSDEKVHLAVWKTFVSYEMINEMRLKQFGEKAVKSDALLVGIGENAGVVDIGQNYAITFKIESLSLLINPSSNNKFSLMSSSRIFAASNAS
jgi:hypothetical protein